MAFTDPFSRARFALTGLAVILGAKILLWSSLLSWRLWFYQLLTVSAYADMILLLLLLVLLVEIVYGLFFVGMKHIDSFDTSRMTTRMSTIVSSEIMISLFGLLIQRTSALSGDTLLWWASVLLLVLSGIEGLFLVSLGTYAVQSKY